METSAVDHWPHIGTCTCVHACDTDTAFKKYSKNKKSSRLLWATQQAPVSKNKNKSSPTFNNMCRVLLLLFCFGFVLHKRKSKRESWRKGEWRNRKMDISLKVYSSYVNHSKCTLYGKDCSFFILDLNFSGIHGYAVSIWFAATQPPPLHMADDLWSPASILLPRNSQIVYTTPPACLCLPAFHSKKRMFV